MNNLRYNRPLPVNYEVDVCVVGGGPAGVAAGVTAARQGAKVLILEAMGFFGGAGTAALVPAFSQFTNGVDFMAGGIGREVHDSVCRPELGRGIDLERLKRTYDQMVQASGAQFLFHAFVTDVVTRDGGVDAVIVAAKRGLYAVKAKIFVDATGDGDICAWAGAPYELGDAAGHVMPSTLCSQWIDIDWDRVEPGYSNRKVEQAYKDGVFTQEDYHMPGIGRTGANTGGGNIGHCHNVNATDERSLTEAMVLGRKILPEFEKYFREYLGGGYEKAGVINSGAYLGVRESRRIIGDYVLGVADFRPDSVFDDEIGRYSYPIDIHAGLGKENYAKFMAEFTAMRMGKGESYSIPYRCLLPRKLNNVLVGGRCVSVDQKMQASIRVMPGCYITGQACGMAAAMAAAGEGDIRRVDVKMLQDKLLGMGAFIPNRK